MITTITFDLDDTLWDGEGVIHHAETVLYRWLQAHYPRLTRRFDLNALRELRHEAAERDPAIAYDLTLVRKAGLRLAAERAGCTPTLVDPAFQVFIGARHDVTLYPDVVPVLTRLRGRYTLGSLTNGNADVRRVSVGSLLHFAVAAGDVGAAKPDSAIFHAACNRAATVPEHTVHVGDDPARDVAGAAAAGLRTIWLNRDHQAWPGGPPPDAEITGLHQLEAVLERCDRG